ncbi:DHH family phosphoesterase [Pullulanibacillus sp. KACC 23026]|uniref:DHH family phosphoesterase n=1 Tax=Pullulanibacillus sp. KACC 23026 TaxID=3028315 RepID=UPI0023B10824|nr:DHH family phosphoesterase [Pullulanibacillus sp. KACC 23026]WEG12806.1 DHH family phosphoesterase [Pullulanibacillus sp. KACC 23026]
MSNDRKPGWQSFPIMAITAISIFYILWTCLFNWILGIVGLVVFIVSAYLANVYKNREKQDLEAYVSTLSHRVKKVGEEALLEMPIGILLYSDQQVIEWMNHYLVSITGEKSLISQSLNLISDTLIPFIKSDRKEEILVINRRRYRVMPHREERLLYFFDITEAEEIKGRYQAEKTVFGIIYLDNYDEVTQGLDDQIRSKLNNEVTNIIKQWSLEHGIYFKRFSSDRFFAVLNEDILKELEKTRFDILDRAREVTAKETIPLTLSIGVGAGATDLLELGQLTQSALDLALGRGGDQVAIKFPSGKVQFYGGKSNPVEKRTRVRARVISQALSELIHESDQVFVMGHQQPDMDAIGAGIGILKIVEANEAKGSIVIDPNDYGPGVIRLIEKLQESERIWSQVVTPDVAYESLTANTLVVVVDTHKPSLVVDQRLLSKTDRVVVIDHHRRSEDFIKDPVLVYMEPYASSTVELVTELLEYQPKKFHLDIIEATAMLAGITVDTKNFTLRTGSRTFDAASYLRAHGADTILVQKLLREDINQFNDRAELIRSTILYREHLAIAVGQENKTYDQVLLAQTADTLLTMNGIKAAFVIAVRPDNRVGISARSLGEINVQILMEEMGGGGHLTNAATQIACTIEEAKNTLIDVIDSYFEGGEDA